MNIKGKNVLLRAIEEKDLEILHKWANEPEIQRWLVGNHMPSSMQDQRKWFETLHLNSVHQRFSIETPNLGLIGTANLVNIDWPNRKGQHGMMLGDKDNRGKGYGYDTVMALMRFAFEELGLNRLESSIIEYNKASMKLYIDKCGWKKEGVKREWLFRKNKFWDLIIVGITRSDYLDLIAKTGYWDNE